MIQINLFCGKDQTGHRSTITKAALNQLASISENNKSQIDLLIYHDENEESLWEAEAYKLVQKNISTTLVSMPNNEYMEKLKIALQSEHEYSCKWDNDVFVNSDIWNYLIENIEVVKDPKVSLLAPTLSNGMPTIELFIKDFLTEKEKEVVGNIFIKDNIVKDIFSCNYNEIISYISGLKSWDGDRYWKVMDMHNPIMDRPHLPWYYSIAKGVHPGRFSYDYNKFILDHAINNIDKVLNSSNLYLEPYITPYFCNNIFLTTTEYWKRSQELFFDNWDEGQLTMLANRENKSPVYVRNCYGIHMAYGCTKNQLEIEKDYIDNLFNKLI
jgi:hypothetical protein